MAKTREIPNLENYTPEGLVEMIYQQRQVQKDANFLEGVYRQRLDAIRDLSASSIDGEKYLAKFIPGVQERLDADKIRSDVSRDELIAKGWLKTTETVTLRIEAK